MASHITHNQAEEELQTLWGHTFKWTSQHASVDQIQSMLHTYDSIANNALDRIDEISPPGFEGWKCPSSIGKGQRDVYSVLQNHAKDDKVLEEFWNLITTVPDWVDWDQIGRGQKVAYQYFGQIALGVSLPGFNETNSSFLSNSFLNSFCSNLSLAVWVFGEWPRL